MRFCGTLREGATILLIAPSSPVRGDAKWQDSAAGLEKRGYKVIPGESLDNSTEKGYAAAPAETRARDITRGFTDPAIDAIWAIRGGSMAAEVLPLLDAEVIAANPKPLIGFSDITALHIYLQEKCGIGSYHAPCASIFGGNPDEYALEAFDRAVRSEGGFEFANPEDQPIRVLKDGEAEGMLAGGNMTLVASLTGTNYALNTKGKILFLEDVEEDVYRLNRMLLQLKYSGILDDAAGLLFGGFTDCPNGYNAEYGSAELLKEFFADYEKPVYYDLSVGHIRRNAAIPMGANCRMKDGKITFRW